MHETKGKFVPIANFSLNDPEDKVTFGIIELVEPVRQIEIKGVRRSKREIFQLKIFCRLCIIRAMIANIGVQKCIIGAMTADDWCAKIL